VQCISPELHRAFAHTIAYSFHRFRFLGISSTTGSCNDAWYTALHKDVDNNAVSNMIHRSIRARMLIPYTYSNQCIDHSTCLQYSMRSCSKCMTLVNIRFTYTASPIVTTVTTCPALPATHFHQCRYFTPLPLLQSLAITVTNLTSFHHLALHVSLALLYHLALLSLLHPTVAT
jgi:hypothetical protein